MNNHKVLIETEIQGQEGALRSTSESPMFVLFPFQGSDGGHVLEFVGDAPQGFWVRTHMTFDTESLRGFARAINAAAELLKGMEDA